MKLTIALCIRLAACLIGIAAAHAQLPIFTQVTDSPIVGDSGNWVWCAWGDFHNSGFLDLIVPNIFGTNAYYQNISGAFTKVDQIDPVQDKGNHVGAHAADYDNDGNLDIAVTSGAFYSLANNRLYHGNGDGAFSHSSGGVFTNLSAYFGPGAWADYDNDGFVDFVVINHGTASPNGGPNVLYHNNGDGSFSRITTGAVVTDFVSSGFCVVWEDYDDDGFPDLLVVNYDNGKNFLYHNNKNGSFSRVSSGIIATDIWSQGSSCAAWGDYDNDGLPDLFVTDGAGVRNQLYHNQGNGTFTRVTSGPQLVPSPGGAFNGCGWGDYNNDGYLDLFVTGFNESNALFRNNGDGTFTKIVLAAPGMGGGQNEVCGAVSWVDYDQDGCLDLFVGLVDGVSEPSFAPGKNLLFHNNGNSNAWLEIKLTGTRANRSAIGAKVRVRATIGGKTFSQLREIGNSGGYNCQPLVAHFGLGQATNVESLRIEWPSGTVQELKDVPASQILSLTEPPLLSVTLEDNQPKLFLKCWKGMQWDVQSSTNLAEWSLVSTVVVTNLAGLSEIPIVSPSTATFYRALGK